MVVYKTRHADYAGDKVQVKFVIKKQQDFEKRFLKIEVKNYCRHDCRGSNEI